MMIYVWILCIFLLYTGLADLVNGSVNFLNFIHAMYSFKSFVIKHNRMVYNGFVYSLIRFSSQCIISCGDFVNYSDPMEIHHSVRCLDLIISGVK